MDDADQYIFLHFLVEFVSMNIVDTETEETALVVKSQEGAEWRSDYLGISLVLVILPITLAVSTFLGLSLSLILLMAVT